MNALIGQRYMNGNMGAFRCRAITGAGCQCRAQARVGVSIILLCRRHHAMLTKRLKPLRYVELHDAHIIGTLSVKSDERQMHAEKCITLP